MSNQADQHTGRRAGSNPPAPAQAVLSLAEGIDLTSHSKSSGSIVPRVPPFKFPHRLVRAQERAMSISPLFTGDGTSTAMAEGSHSRIGATHSSSRGLHFQSRLTPGPLCSAPRTLHRARSNKTPNAGSASYILFLHLHHLLNLISSRVCRSVSISFQNYTLVAFLTTSSSTALGFQSESTSR